MTTAFSMHLDVALCATSTLDPETWFPHPSETDTLARAAAVCGDCPLRVMCAERAVTAKHDGVWGGTLFARGRVVAPRTG